MNYDLTGKQVEFMLYGGECLTEKQEKVMGLVRQPGNAHRDESFRSDHGRRGFVSVALWGVMLVVFVLGMCLFCRQIMGWGG